MTDELSTVVSTEQSSTPSNTENQSTETARHDALEQTSNTLDASIDNAFDKVFGNDTKQEKQETSRDEKGRYAPKAELAPTPDAPAPVTPTATEQTATPAVAIEAPSRFSPDAKAAWATTPEPVKAEINRAMGEMQQGLQEYQARYAPLKPFEDAAKQHGTTIEAALQNYTSMENMLTNDPVNAFEKICEFIGKTPQQFFEEISNGQQRQANADPIVSQLQQQVQALQQQLSGVSTSIQSQQDVETEQRINAWASDKPRFTELRDTMIQLAQSGMANDLDTAYQMAERLKPATVQVQPAIQQKPDLKAQTQKGQLSTYGAPVSGSNPAYRKPASSASEAIERSFAQLGLG
jgi:hypothetical protein